MFFRSTLSLAGGLLLVVTAQAQTHSAYAPAPGVKHAGTYHAATGTWSRSQTSAPLGSHDVIYDNTCNVGWYLYANDNRIVDEGRLPSTSSPQGDQDPPGSGTWLSTSLIGTDDSYLVNWYEIGYCTPTVTPDVEASWWDCFNGCADATLITPVQTIRLTGAPGTATAGTVACWLVNLDLAGSTLNFTLQADCDGTWDGSPALDNFGFSYWQVTPDPLGISGPLVRGDPDGLLLAGPGNTGCCVGCNTVFWAGSNWPGTAVEGSGLANGDLFEYDDAVTGTFNGCYWFGGYSTTTISASIYMEIQGESSGYSGEPGAAYCFGNTSQGNACPCANDNDQTDLAAGCANGTFAAGAHLGASGAASIANDTVLLMGTRGQPSNSSMFFQALNDLDGAGSFLGDGIRCAGGNLKRLKVKLNDGNGDADTTGTVITVRSAQLGYTILAGDTLRYQWWYRDNNNPPCGLGVNDSNTSNGYEITWVP